jgi:DNA-binding response OmpR family regulator
MSAPSRSRVLVVADDADLQAVLDLLLGDEGYESQVATSLDTALSLVNDVPFDLVLADLYVGQHQASLTPANILRRRVQPTPVGLLTTQLVPPDETASIGFAFVLPMPFDVEHLLALVATTLRVSWSPEQERQAETTRRFFAALGA